MSRYSATRSRRQTVIGLIDGPATSITLRRRKSRKVVKSANSHDPPMRGPPDEIDEALAILCWPDNTESGSDSHL
jgi:hypothetical protein